MTGIGNIASTGLEDIYILEYIFENFSYNTIVQDAVVKEEKATFLPEAMNALSDENIAKAQEKIATLSNYNINTANNYLNGAEIEYIVYGNSDPEKNVTYAKSSIYALRMVFNTIYAFKDAEIRNETRSVGLAVQAATAGFVPYQVVQVVLQLALAAAESGIDLAAMNAGLSVAIVKTDERRSQLQKIMGNINKL